MKTTKKHRKHVEFHVGDLVWIHLMNVKFPQGKVDSPFKVLKRNGKNAYEIELFEGYGLFPTFNVLDLSPYHGDGLFEDLTTSFFQPNENEMGVSLYAFISNYMFITQVDYSLISLGLVLLLVI